MKLDEAIKILDESGYITEAYRTKISYRNIDILLDHVNKIKKFWEVAAPDFVYVLDKAGISYTASIEFNSEYDIEHILDLAGVLKIKVTDEDIDLQIYPDEDDKSDIWIEYEIDDKQGSIRSNWNLGPDKVLEMIQTKEVKDD